MIGINAFPRSVRNPSKFPATPTAARTVPTAPSITVAIERPLSFRLNTITAFKPALFIVEYWSLGKGKAENFTLREGWSVAGIVTWALGFAATFLTVGISFINGMLVSGILYLVWRLVKKGDK